ncbi:MAG: type II toxin-antitoxin system prevent-host-death family antitoxin [Bacteroidetes bacterium]|nr:type II toxin-antitoxin system prevent-host-death family antitoxin [Bacteroidota bacterium]
MEVTTLTDFRRNMKAYFEKVLKLGKPLFISRPKGNDMVLMSKSEYNSMQETFHLLRSPKNAERLLKSIEDDKAGKVEAHDLIH